MQMSPWALAFALVPALSALSALQAKDPDPEALARHIIESISPPAGVKFTVKDFKPSPVPGFKMATLESDYRGRRQSQSLYITEDNRYYFLTEAERLGPSSNLPGFLTNVTEGGQPSRIHVSKDGSFAFIGEAYDFTVDLAKERMKKINLSGVPFRGSPKAKVTIVEYSDLQCPYCKNAHLELEKNLQAAYGKKVRWVFKHFPLTSIHPWAYPGGIAVACAQKQKPEASWTMTSAFFEHSKDVTAGNIREKALEFAKEAGLNVEKFGSCYDNQESKAIVDADMQEAQSLGVNSTPTFIVNGRRISGFGDFESFKQELDPILKTAP